jgi:endoglycosylceramidase
VLLAVAIGWVSAQPVTQRSEVPPPASAVPSAGWLRSVGGRIEDQQARTVLLRGFNYDALLDWRNAEPGPRTPLDDTDATLMRRAGFDVVRLPISWSLLEPRRHEVSAGYLDRVVAAVRLLERHGLRVVLDMHVGIGWGPSPPRRH